MNKHYEHIRKVCIEKNPSILDLVMGCEVKYHYEDDNQGEYRVAHFIGRIDEGIKAVYNNNMIYIADYEILGRHITLQDVMFAFYARAQSECSKYEGEGVCECWNAYWDEQIDYLLNIYNLKKPFSEQPEEFYKWCAEQLGYEEGRTLEQALTPENIERAVKESTQDYEDFLRDKGII